MNNGVSCLNVHIATAHGIPAAEGNRVLTIEVPAHVLYTYSEFTGGGVAVVGRFWKRPDVSEVGHLGGRFPAFHTQCLMQAVVHTVDKAETSPLSMFLISIVTMLSG
jgi:hypothetical protein